MKSSLLNNFKNTPFFTISNLRSITDEGDNTLYHSIKRWLDKGVIIQLKKGYYTTKEYFLKMGDQNYREFIASILRKPSYLSCEYILQKYNLLTEATFPISSITTKSSRTYQNDLGTFIYYNIKDPLYIGFEERIYGEHKYHEATKAKALFDFIYLRRDSLYPEAENFVEELRFNLDELKKKEWKELGKYCRASQSKKMKAIFDKLVEYSDKWHAS